MTLGERISNSNSDPDTDQRRSGASDNDPHGGHEHIGERRGPDPDPIDELVPAGDGSLPSARKPGILDEMGDVDGMQTIDPRAQPGFGPTELDRPLIEGNPELGIDPNDVRDEKPPEDV